MVAIGISGVIGGMGGSVFALQIGFVAVEIVFGLTIPLFVIVMSVLGGRTHWLGPVIGAAVIVLLQDRLAAGAFEQWRLIIFGGLLAVMVIVAPDGLYARLRARPLAAAGRRGDRCWRCDRRLGGNLLDWLLLAMLVDRGGGVLAVPADPAGALAASGHRAGDGRRRRPPSRSGRRLRRPRPRAPGRRRPGGPAARTGRPAVPGRSTAADRRDRPLASRCATACRGDAPGAVTPRPVTAAGPEGRRPRTGAPPPAPPRGRGRWSSAAT